MICDECWNMTDGECILATKPQTKESCRNYEDKEEMEWAWENCRDPEYYDGEEDNY
jgi:hypothetical protein